MAVNVSECATAGEIVQRLVKRSHINRGVLKNRYSNSSMSSLDSLSSNCSDDNSGSMSPEEDVKQFLFEVGGNIGKC